MRKLLDAIAGARSLRVPDADRLHRLDRIDAIVIVGATGAGKSTIAGAIRDCPLARQGRVAVPPRYLTRPARGSDSATENIHVSVEEFEACVQRAVICLRWIRPMEGNRTEHYGFRAPARGILPVYSGNNALYANAASVQPAGVLRNALFVGIYAPDRVREERLRKRSPDLSPAEVAYRLADKSENMIPQVHVVAENHGALENVSPREVVTLVMAVAESTSPAGCDP
jgi:ribose 1,5-bisphosphokinase PhnN